MLEVMNLIHDKYSVANMNHINSIHVSKFVGQSSHREQQNDYSPYLSPDSDIYNIFLGDSLPSHSLTIALMKNLNITLVITVYTQHQLNPNITGLMVSIALLPQIAR